MKIYSFDERCQSAKEEVCRYVASHEEWQADVASGKMFGVLIYEGGYLAAFSGTLGGRTTQPGFVPPVYDLMQPGSFFLKEEAEISELNRRIASGELTPSQMCDFKHQRRVRSQELQKWLFRQYSFLNVSGEQRTLADLWGDAVPPSASGDCCAPKLLQEAFRRGLKPIAMTEWYSVNGEFRPPCQNRCRPILSHMLRGLQVDPDPRMEKYMRLVPKLRVVHEDSSLLIVDKPSGLLSVPGREFFPSVESILAERYGDIYMVHRLDQDTSGIMVVARSLEVQVALRRQFETRQVAKRYVAVLRDEMPDGAEGDVALPLRPDVEDRPRQMVDYEHGKTALTHYRAVGRVGTHAVVELTPHTGRTHQLRVHCSHADGLHNPIVGDRLYGTESHRLCLHAQELSFYHPRDGESMTFTIPIDIPALLAAQD